MRPFPTVRSEPHPELHALIGHGLDIFRKPSLALEPVWQQGFRATLPYWENRVNKRCHCIDDLRQTMQARVSLQVADYFLGGAGQEITLKNNVEAFNRVAFNARFARRFDSVDMEVTILGQKISMPVIAAPVGSLRTLFPVGEAVAASVIGKAGTICTLSTLTGTRLEDVKEAANGPCWFQLYLVGGREVAVKAILRAKEAGYSALVLTIDTPVAGHRMRDHYNGTPTLLHGTLLQKLPYAPQTLWHFNWLMGFYGDGGLMDFPNIQLKDGKPMVYADIGKQLENSAVTWADVEWIREAWGHGPLIIKGVQTIEDAKLAMEYGAAAIVISNHGGRQLDRSPSTLKMLAEIGPYVDRKQTRVLMDGGVRSGADVLIARALGADAVLIGRAYAYGLGAGGGVGVSRALELIRADISHHMRLLGYQSINEVGRECIHSLH